MESVRFDYRLDIDSKSRGARVVNDSLEKLADFTGNIRNAVKAVSVGFPSTRIISDVIPFPKIFDNPLPPYIEVSVHLQTFGTHIREITNLFVGLAGCPQYVNAHKSDYEKINRALEPYGKRLETDKESHNAQQRPIRDLEAA